MPFYVDEEFGKVYDTEYDYAIMLAKKVKKEHKDSSTIISMDFIISALGHGKNLELARRKRKAMEKA